MEPWDWKGTLTLDREKLKEELEHLKKLLEEYPSKPVSRRHPYCIVSATDEDDARAQVTERLIRFHKIPLRFHKNLRVRRLP